MLPEQLPDHTSNNPLIKLIAEPRYRWLRHTLFISFGLILAFWNDIRMPGTKESSQLQKTALWTDALTFIFVTGCIYLLIYVLIPKLLFRSKVFWFASSFIALITLIYLQVWFVDYYYLRPLGYRAAGISPHIDFSFIASIQLGAVTAILLASVMGLQIFKKWINDTKHMKELYQAKLRAEVEQLKSQVNPHFLFNTLNNLYVLTKTDPDKASQVILGLSDLLRYQLYDSAKEKIILSRDIDFLRNLLTLEKLRRNDFEFRIDTQGRTDGVMLSPFLFIPFVENAIKHGASATGNTYLYLDFRLTETHLHFRSENSVPSARKTLVGGLGLKNLKRRLELLYRENYSLEVKDDTNKYIVELTVPLL